jgi:cytochrome b6-f complex iron-sulfur subunit
MGSRKQTRHPSERKAPADAKGGPSEVRTAGELTDGKPQSRRRLLGQILLGLGGIAVLEYVWLAVQFLRPRRVRRAADSEAIILAGPVERFAKGSVTAFPQGRFYLARLEDGGFLALSRRCTHLGCTVPWVPDEGKFVCPCHASAFDVRGEVQKPPAPRPLDLFQVRIENGIVKVDTTSPMTRHSFANDQVVHA